MSARLFLGSARASRAGDGAFAIADFSMAQRHTLRRLMIPEECFGEAPKTTREARALPRKE
jgi:hypothetical protein